MKSRLLVSLAFLLTSGAALADSLDVNIHDDALRIVYGASVNSVSRGAEVELGHMYNNEDDYVSHIGFIVSGENWSNAGVFDIGLGGRALRISADPLDVTALALGGRVRFSPIHRVGVGAFVFHAPDIVAFDDAEAYTEYGVRFDYQLLPQGFVYLGYRNIELKMENWDSAVQIDDNGHVGMRLLF